MQPPYPPGPPYPRGQPYPPQQQEPPKKKGMPTCLIVGLVLLALSIPIGGIFAATAIYGVRKYLATAKTAEAKNNISAIARSAVAAYERDGKHHLCGSATRVPATVPKAAKYAPSSAPGADFHSGDETKGWTCLRFDMNYPFYYQYGYETGPGSGKSGATANGFEASARGDLDGNGTTSLFARSGEVKGNAVVLSTNLYIENEFE